VQVLLEPQPLEEQIDPLGPMLPLDARTPVPVRFSNVNQFLGLYLTRLRHGGTVIVPAPRYTFTGDLVDLEVRIDAYRPLLLFAQVVTLQRSRIEVRVVCGPSTDELVRPMLVRALGARHARGLLTAPGR
jgi:hypothetical protein